VKRLIIGFVAIVGLSSAIVAALLVDWDPEHARREAFIYHCNEEGAGGMFTSRDYCEELYREQEARKAPKNSN
jgi:hypothetical protein